MRSRGHGFLHDSPTSMQQYANYLHCFSSSLFFVFLSLIVFMSVSLLAAFSFGLFFSISPLTPPHLPHLMSLSSSFKILSHSYFLFLPWTPLIFWPSVCEARWVCWGSERFWEPLWLFSVLCVCACCRLEAVVRSSLPFQWMYIEAWCLHRVGLPQQATARPKLIPASDSFGNAFLCLCIFADFQKCHL